MMHSSTAAVVVSFNRKELLCECIESLLRQSVPLDAIFIVDNGSTDGTRDLLQERGYLDRSSVRYLSLSHNTGGAGGFYAGMTAAQNCGYDWVWIMDDDTEPYLDALEKMQEFKQYLQVVAIANRKVDGRGNETADGIRFMRKHQTGGKPYIPIKFSSFVGLLIRCSAIERVGFPKQEFFIHNDDTEYCLRLRSIGDIAIAHDSIVAHKEIARSQKGKRFFSYTFYQKDIRGFCFGYFGHRNYAWIQQHYCKNPFVRFLNLAGRFVCFAAAVLTLDHDHRWLRIKILARANLDGIRGHFDNELPQRILGKIERREFPTPG